MKKLLTLTLALILTLSVCACTNEPTDTHAVTTDGVSDTATETAAETETETEFVPTDDNVVYSDVDSGIIMSGMFIRTLDRLDLDYGEIYIMDNLREAMEDAGTKRLAVIRDGSVREGGVFSDPLDNVSECCRAGDYVAFLTAEEIEEITVNGDTKLLLALASKNECTLGE